MLSDTLSTWTPHVRSLLRIISGALMMQHGAQKLFGFMSDKPLPEAGSFIWFGGVIEFFVALLLVIGLFSRSAAFLLSGTMAVAYFKAHAPQGFWPIVNKGELAVIYCWVYFYLFFAGPGPLSVDAVMNRKK